VLRAILRRLLWNLLLDGKAVPPVPPTPIADRLAGDPPAAADEPPADRLPATQSGSGGHQSGVIAVPVALILQREAQIAKALEEAKVVPDLACLLALRRLMATIAENNARSGWLLDAPTAGRPN